MKISDAIVELESLQGQYGDLVMMTREPNNETEIWCEPVFEFNDDQGEYILVTDGAVL